MQALEAMLVLEKCHFLVLDDNTGLTVDLGVCRTTKTDGTFANIGENRASLGFPFMENAIHFIHVRKKRKPVESSAMTTLFRITRCKSLITLIFPPLDSSLLKWGTDSSFCLFQF